MQVFFLFCFVSLFALSQTSLHCLDISRFPDTPSPQYAMMPEYVARNVAAVISTLGKYPLAPAALLFIVFFSFVPTDSFILFSDDTISQEVLNASQCTWSVTLMSHLIGSAKFVKNPFIRSDFVEILLGLVNKQSDSGISLVLEEPRMTSILMPGLLQLYVDFEHTGGVCMHVCLFFSWCTYSSLHT